MRRTLLALLPCFFLFAAPALAAATAMPPLPVKKPQSIAVIVKNTTAEKPVPKPEETAEKETPAKNNDAAEPAKDKPSAEPAQKNSGAEPAQKNSGAESAPLLDVAEGNLPAYPQGAQTAIGTTGTYVTEERDTFIDIARHFNLGYVELRAANPDIDPWAPTPGTNLIIPGFTLLPRTRQVGIVVNLGKMRLYYFKDKGQPPISFPIGIGQQGLQTPTGETTIIRKVDGPVWRPTPRMREEKPWLPAAVYPGPDDPLGTHALYLGWPEYLIHGTDKPWGIGRRVSSGCMRMYPEDIIQMFNMVPVGTPVTVVNQPVLVAWVKNRLYLEANPTQTQSLALEFDETMQTKPLTDAVRKLINDTAGTEKSRIDWGIVKAAMLSRSGYPVLIATRSPKEKTAAKQAENKAASAPAKDKHSAEPARKPNGAEPARKSNSAEPARKPNSAEPARKSNSAEPAQTWSYNQ